jgi:histidinol-phosphate phosphatase family protein
MDPAVFLDRDGVIIENRDSYVLSWDDVAFIPRTLQALANLSRCKYKVLIVTNQSAVGRGLITRESVDAINVRIVAEISASGGHVDGVFMCPHDPNSTCSCRKPKPGLLLEAAEAHSVDLSKSIIVGDTINDLLAGHAAGIQDLVLVKTGLGSEQLTLSRSQDLPQFKVVESLYDVAITLTE